ncbi:secreted protein [Streptantibioticus cattleyicolor NRRL 8057 = DSM 46488]|uniref:Secreted protein n=1 Tax=Streptantibioticus cattleyicolor (strain ATCC 35852 / DSM 46488 / JCM 4925 / NBRC 14057 / NRRL 8057) TaxID=1003195 RepID=F8K4G7_STREN|nr:secreted protein [Streptantibioticus cattleyicolor NRRL 8057 = DSM 46488]CCB75468.1 putative secreted protein [Streptantibioticus cattleyicolor NRRL 8057 = DSM 46488]
MRRRALLGTAVLVVLVALAGLAAYITRDGRSPSKASAAGTSSAVTAASPTPSSSGPPTPGARHNALPVPPDTHDPIVFGKAAAAALWSYDTRSYSQVQLLAALHRWLTTETKYADPASVDAIVPSPVLWKEMAANDQFATAKVNEGHFPDSFTQALQAAPGAITEAYVYAVTVSGKQSIAWKGSPAGGAEDRVITLAVQCRPNQPCALAGVMPSVAP